MSDDTWQPRELPILKVIADADRDGRRVTSTEIAERTGLKLKDVRIGLGALIQGGYLAGQHINTPGEAPGSDYAALRLLSPGRRATDQWPQEPSYLGLLKAVEQVLASMPDSDERSRLERFRDAGRDLSIGTLSNVLAAWIRDVTGRGGF